MVSTDVESGNQTFYKIVSQRYHDLSLLRGNTYDIPTRYVELRIESPEKVDAFIRLFSEYASLFMAIETRIDKLIDHMVAKYRERFVKGKYAPVHKMLYPFMKHIRQNCEMFDNVTREMVTRYFADQPVVYIMKMLSVDF